MSKELAVVAGLGFVAWMTVTLMQRFRESESMIEEAANVLSMLFIIGLELTAHEVAVDATGMDTAADAYLAALLVSVLVFTGSLVELVRRYWRETREDNEFGYFGRQ